MDEPSSYHEFRVSRPRALPELFNAASFHRICGGEFARHVASLRGRCDVLQEGLHPLASYAASECWLDSERQYGFAVTPDRELSNVFSLVRGGGSRILTFATQTYDRLHLNCFSYVAPFYTRYGFTVEGREANWDSTPDHPLPDIVLMRWQQPG